jgi:hypothetical protein
LNVLINQKLEEAREQMAEDDEWESGRWINEGKLLILWPRCYVVVKSTAVVAQSHHILLNKKRM